MENKIKSAEEVLDEFENYSDDYHGCIVPYSEAIKAMKIYATQMIEAQLEIAAEEATIEDISNPWEYFPDYVVDRESIMNCTRIKLD